MNAESKPAPVSTSGTVPWSSLGGVLLVTIVCAGKAAGALVNGVVHVPFGPDLARADHPFAYYGAVGVLVLLVLFFAGGAFELIRYARKAKAGSANA